MDLKQKKAVTLIELLMVIVIIGILAIGGAHFMIYLLQNENFIPNQLNMNMLASDALDIMIEGDSQAKGLRYNKTINGVADYQVDFTNLDGQNVSYRLNTGTNKLERSLAGPGGPWTVFPYYMPLSGVTITGKNNKVFVYYTAAEATTNTAANVRRVEMTLIGKTGTGNYAQWEGQSEQISSVAVKRFQ